MFVGGTINKINLRIIYHLVGVNTNKGKKANLGIIHHLVGENTNKGEKAKLGSMINMLARTPT